MIVYEIGYITSSTTSIVLFYMIYGIYIVIYIYPDIDSRQMDLLCWFHPHAVTCICPIASGLQASLSFSCHHRCIVIEQHDNKKQ